MPLRRPTMLFALVLALVSGAAPAGQRLTLMSFNAWGGGLNEGKPIDETLAVLRAVDADIIGLQEMRAESGDCETADCPPGDRSVAAALAAGLGYHLYAQEGPEDIVWAGAIMSRHPMLGATPNGLGVAIDVAGQRVYAFNIHATDFPYQPYQVLGIPYGDAPFLDSAEQLVAAAGEARGETLDALIAETAAVPQDAVAVVFGDFNEPSHRDWSQRAAEQGRHPLAVDFPFARGLEEAGFVDAYRAVFPDEITHPGFTWTPITAASDPADHHDRIDYVFVRGAREIESAAIAGEKRPEADIVVTPWPSDHRAVVVTIVVDQRIRARTD